MPDKLLELEEFKSKDEEFHLSAMRSQLNDGRQRVSVRLEYVRGRYEGVSMTIQEATRLRDLLGETIEAAKLMKFSEDI